MKVIITSKGFTANEKQTALIEKKFEKLSKYFNDDVTANVTMGFKKGRQTMETQIVAKGTIFRAEVTDSDMNVCLDKVVDKLTAQIRKYKKKLQNKHQNHKEYNFDAMPDDVFEDLDTETLKPVKEKNFALDTMTVEEAILQMELLGHTFYVFMNGASGSVCVVYKRADGAYGLLKPEY